MIDLNDITALENHFSENIETPLFPLLADKYYEQEDYVLSKKVCNTGLSFHPESCVGNYILAKLELLEEKHIDAEILLKKVIKINPVHILAMHILLSLQIKLDRNRKTINNTIMLILAINPDDETCKNWLDSIKVKKENKNNVDSNKNSEIKSEPETSPEPEKIIEKDSSQKITPKKFTINKQLASVTLAQVYIKQGHYDQALQVLQVVKNKDTKNKKIDEEIEVVQNLINESNNNE